MILWVLTIFSVGLALGAIFKCRVSGRRIEAQQRVWREAMIVLARRDYSAARALANRTHDAFDSEQLNALKAAADALEAENREQERARRELSDVLASLQDAVLVVDGEAHLRFLNAAALSLFGIRVEDVLGAALLEALPSFGLDDAVREALREGRSSARETALYAPQTQRNKPNNGATSNGATRGRREVLLRVAPVRRSDGRVTGAVAILQDLTEMRRLERVRREFVANASHELRTPVANIRASAETILEDPDDPVLRARFLPNLVAEAERLSRLISDLLDLARIESHIEASRAPVDVCRIARDVVERLQPKAEQHDVKVSWQCDDGCDTLPISGDAAGLDQVAFNLLDNALMYTPGGGHVEVGVRTLRDEHADEEKDENCTTSGVVLWVRDTGIGIPTEDLPRVFERFYRVDKARSRAQGGTGLGLAIVKHIVENHGGHIKVESEPGQGTTFTVTLPGT